MLIRPDLRRCYGPDWREVSRAACVEAGWRCEACGKPHGATPHVLPDGRWTLGDGTWRNRRGRQIPAPTLLDYAEIRGWKVPVWLALAHRGHDPRRRDDLVVWCPACHLRHDLPWHRRQRWVTVRARYAAGDLLLGRYDAWRLPAAWKAPRLGRWFPRHRN